MNEFKVGDIVRHGDWKEGFALAVVKTDEFGITCTVPGKYMEMFTLEYFILGGDLWEKTGEMGPEFSYNIKLFDYKRRREAAKGLAALHQELLGEMLDLQKQGVKVEMSVPL